MSEYEDLREAIRSTVLVKASSGAKIIHSEHGGERDAWMFDFRALMLQPKWLNRYAEIFWERYEKQYPFQVGGMETAAIALIAAIVMKGVERGTPVNGFYLRKSRKRQGLMKQLEGTLTDDPIILVDDLSNSAQTFAKQLDILDALEKKVTDIFVMLAFREPSAYAFFKERGVRFDHLFSLRDFGIAPRAADAQVPHSTFSTLWHFVAPEPSHHIIVQKSAPILHGSHILFGCDDGIFRALDQERGNLAWEYKVGRFPMEKGILSSPAIHEDTVYFGAYDGEVYALDARDGTKKWTYSDADWIGSSPALATNLGILYIGLEFGLFRKRGGIAALDMRTGREIWRAIHPNLTHASPLYIMEENLVLIGSNNGLMYAYDAKTGAPSWQFATRGDIKTSAVYDAEKKLLVFGSMDGTLYALDARSGAPVYARATGAGIYSTPLIVGRNVYVASLDKYLYALNLDTGKDLWEFATSGRIFAAPAYFEGSLWIGSNDGRLYELNAETGALKGFFQTTERVVNRPAFNPKTKRIFVPTSANEIYCIERAPIAH